MSTENTEFYRSPQNETRHEHEVLGEFLPLSLNIFGFDTK
jgi:hypothetical protein